LPIERIVLAHNSNRAVPDYLMSGEWRPRASIATLASAMDVGNPSNMERLRSMYPAIDSLRSQLSADSVDDAAIRARIATDYREFGRIWCPHTATAAELYRRLPPEARQDRPWVLVATAHPAKFNEIVEPLIGKAIEVPAELAKLLSLPQQHQDISPTLPALAAALA
jgi:threonine synthase